MTRLCLESRLAILIFLLFGLWAVFVVPPVVTFDAPGHYYRSLQVSRGEFRAPTVGVNRTGGTFAKSDLSFVDGQWVGYWKRHDFGTLSSWAARSRESALLTGVGTKDFTNIALESPVNHFVQGLGMRCAALFSAEPLWKARAGCLFNLLAFLALIVATIETLPDFRRGFLLFVCSPLSLIQAASLSHDAVNVSLAALFVAVVWRMRTTREPAPASTLLALVVLGGLIALTKSNAIANLCCFLLLPTVVFGAFRRRVATVLLLFGFAAAMWLLWNLPYRNLDVAAAIDPLRPACATALQKHHFFHHPFSFMPAFGRFLARDVWEQWPVFFGGVGGWVQPSVGRALSLLSLVFLAGLLGAEPAGVKRDLPWSAGLVLQSFALLFATCLICWIALGTVGSGVVPGLGGRYLLPFYLVFFAGLLPWRPRALGRLADWGFATGLAADVAGLLVILVPTTVTVWG